MCQILISQSSEKRAIRAMEVLRGALSGLFREDYLPVAEPGILVGLVLVVLVRRRMLDSGLARVLSEVAPCGFAGVLGNKGAVACRFLLRNRSVCFVSVHLPAGTESSDTQARETALSDTLSALTAKFGRRSAPGPLAHDMCVCLGDFNSRVGVPRDVADAAIREAQWTALLSCDELTKRPPKGLHEAAPVRFAPTYKFDVGTEDVYDTSAKRRTPSWTDRILYSSTGGQVTCKGYTSVPQLTASDHKPVVALLKWQVPYAR